MPLKPSTQETNFQATQSKPKTTMITLITRSQCFLNKRQLAINVLEKFRDEWRSKVKFKDNYVDIYTHNSNRWLHPDDLNARATGRYDRWDQLTLEDFEDRYPRRSGWSHLLELWV